MSWSTANELRSVTHYWLPPRQIVNEAEGTETPFEEVERFAFYERSKKAFAVVITG